MKLLDAGLKISQKEHNTFQGTGTERMWRIIKEKHSIYHSIG